MRGFNFFITNYSLYLYSKLNNMKNSVNRIGNWYNVNVDGITYEVVIQREHPHTNHCEPSSILVFEQYTFKPINDINIIDKVEKLMEKMDWEYDIVEQ